MESPTPEPAYAEYEERGAFANGKRTGEWSSWSRDPETLARVRLTEKHYVDGRAHGWYRRWDSNGVLAEEGQYIENAKDGPWRSFAPDGTWIFEGTFDRGIPVGAHRDRYMNGQVASQRVYDEVGRPHGDWCFWLTDGTLINCTAISNGTGHLKEYDRSGELTREYEVRDGELHGRLVDHNYGLNRYETFYREGAQHGPERVFRGDCVEREATWTNGKLEGPFAENQCEGEPVELVRGQNCGGHPCGRWVMRDHATGNITEITEYSDSGDTLGRVTYGEDGEIVDFWGSVAP